MTLAQMTNEQIIQAFRRYADYLEYKGTKPQHLSMTDFLEYESEQGEWTPRLVLQPRPIRDLIRDEIRIIEEGYVIAITNTMRSTAQRLYDIIAECTCRQCGKKYQMSKSRADLQGFCSATCQHAKSKSCGFRKGKGRSEYESLKRADAVGSVYVVQ